MPMTSRPQSSFIAQENLFWVFSFWFIWFIIKSAPFVFGFIVLLELPSIYTYITGGKVE